MNILYGSETGTARDVAEMLRYDIFLNLADDPEMVDNLHLSPIDDFDFSNPTKCQNPFIFIVATTGQGDPPKNMSKFYTHLLKSNLTSSDPVISKIKNYTVLGLGDSNYKKFNFIGKFLHRRLESLGCDCLLEPGFADEAHQKGSEAVIVPFIQQLLEEFDFDYFGSLNGSKLAGLAKPQPQNEQPVAFEDFISANFTAFDRVTAENHWQDTRIIKIQVPVQPKENQTVESVHTISIQPKNSDDLVSDFVNLFAQPLQKSSKFEVDQFRQLAVCYFDLMACPRAYFFLVLSWFAEGDYKDKLYDLARFPDNRYEYVNRPRRTTLEVLQDFKPVLENFDLDYIFDLMGPMIPREYSIAGCREMGHENQRFLKIELLVAMVEYETRLPTPRIGLASQYFKNNLKIGGNLSVKLNNRPKNFVVPGPEEAIILVGPGTGLAPLKFIIEKYPDNKKLLYWRGVYLGNETRKFYDKIKNWKILTIFKSLKFVEFRGIFSPPFDILCVLNF